MQLRRNQTVPQTDTNPTIYKIGDLAREFHVSLRTLRFYEDKGIVTPSRTGTTRLYSSHDREMLRLALFGKRIGLSLSEVRTMLELHVKRATSARTELLTVYRTQLDALKDVQRETEATIEDLKLLIAELEA